MKKHFDRWRSEKCLRRMGTKVAKVKKEVMQVASTVIVKEKAMVLMEMVNLKMSAAQNYLKSTLYRYYCYLMLRQKLSRLAKD
jgi:ABC-type hemin transport system substrate-binding protein